MCLEFNFTYAVQISLESGGSKGVGALKFCKKKLAALSSYYKIRII